MADEEQKQAEEKKDKKGKTEDAKGGGMMQWIIIGVMLIVMMTVGFFLGHMMGTPPNTADAQNQEKKEGEKKEEDKGSEDLFSEEPAETGWFYPLEDVATTLKDPGSTRYVRALLTLEMVPESDETKTTEYLNTKKKPIILDILNIYFAGLTVEDINSDKDLRRIQYELLNLLNENLSPDSKPLIKRILIQEFGIQ